MASGSSPPKPGGMLSLYANLLDPSADNSPGTISRAPVVFKQAEGEGQSEESAKKQVNNGMLFFFGYDSCSLDYECSFMAALRFQPTKRPQLATQKPKPKPALPKAAPVAPAAAPVKSTLADWAGTEEDDVNGFYAGPKRQRGGRKKRKKNREAQEFVQNWDDIYDPSRPNIYEEYKHSDEQISEVREWKDRLYAHRMARSPSRDSYSDEDYGRPVNRELGHYLGSPMGKILSFHQGNLRHQVVLHHPPTSMISLQSPLVAVRALLLERMHLHDGLRWPQVQLMHHRRTIRRLHLHQMNQLPKFRRRLLEMTLIYGAFKCQDRLNLHKLQQSHYKTSKHLPQQYHVHQFDIRSRQRLMISRLRKRSLKKPLPKSNQQKMRLERAGNVHSGLARKGLLSGCWPSMDGLRDLDWVPLDPALQNLYKFKLKNGRNGQIRRVAVLSHQLVEARLLVAKESKRTWANLAQ